MRPVIPINRFLVLGRAGMDFYAEPPGTPIEQAKHFFPALGGSAANIATAITRLGGQAALVTTLSDDAVGRYVMAELRRYAVDAVYCRTISGSSRTSLAVVETRADHCQSVLYRNDAADFLLSRNDIDAIDFTGYGALILTGTALAVEPSREAAFHSIHQARQADIPVILDVDYRAYSWTSREEAATVCLHAADQSDVIVGNDEEFEVLAQGDNGLECAKRLAEKEGRIVLYKMGEKGTRIFLNHEESFLPIYRVTALKPTGAGDSFMGGVVTGLAMGLSLEESVKRGSAAAAIVVTRVGCSPANPTSAELDAFLAERA